MIQKFAICDSVIGVLSQGEIQIVIGTMQSRWEAHSAWDLLFTVLDVVHSLVKSKFKVGRTDLAYCVPLEYFISECFSQLHM